MSGKKSELLITEYGGTGRSGKGTIVSYLDTVHDNVTTDETGADYRAVTFGLLEQGDLEADMSRGDIQRVMANIGFKLIVDMAADRKAIVAQYGLDSLYTPEVGGLVSFVSPLPEVRRAVKAGFKARIEAVRDSGDYEVLAVDGRNLAPVVNDIEGTRLIMRTFVSCSPAQAALRDCLKNGIMPLSPKAQQIHASIVSRNHNDATRELDPVRPDDDAIDYHGAQDIGVGTLAAVSGRQVHLDTTYMDKGDMLEVTDQMFEEALEASRQTV